MFTLEHPSMETLTSPKSKTTLVGGNDVRMVYFELTNHCNFRCDFCPHSFSKRPRQHLDISLFTKGIDDIVKHKITDTVAFHVLGEPLLYPQVFEAISYAKGKGLITTLTTNGSLLTAEIVEELQQAKLDRMNISLQRYGKDQHDCRRAPLSFTQYYLRIINAVKQVHCSNHETQITIFLMSNLTKRFFTIDKPMQDTWDQSKLRESLETVISDICSALNLELSRDEIQARLTSKTLRPGTRMKVGSKVSITIKTFVDWGNAFANGKIHTTRFGYCGLALSTISVLSSGMVVPCCGDYDGQIILGDLRENTISEILRTDLATSILESFQRLRVRHPECQRCMGGNSPLNAFFKAIIATCMFKLTTPGGGDPLNEVVVVGKRGEDTKQIPLIEVA